MKNWITAIAMALTLIGAVQADDTLRTTLAGAQRTPAFVARDVWRHPYETLAFFGLKPDQTVVELSPGGGWYTEILAPYLRAQGTLVLAADDPNSADAYLKASAERLQKKLNSQPDIYNKVQLCVFAPPLKLQYAVPASADLVLTFRNVHNWTINGEDHVKAVFQSVFASLKPGGVFGVVEHRLPAQRVQDAATSTGYVHVDYVKRVAESVGFTLAASSEINANPKDSADHLGGVWALPPSFVNKDVGRAGFEAIGESDRMTLKFVKPR